MSYTAFRNCFKSLEFVDVESFVEKSSLRICLFFFLPFKSFFLCLWFQQKWPFLTRTSCQENHLLWLLVELWHFLFSGGVDLCVCVFPIMRKFKTYCLCKYCSILFFKRAGAQYQTRPLWPPVSYLSSADSAWTALRPEAGTCRDLLPAYGKGYLGMAGVTTGHEQQPLTPMGNSCGAV